MSCLPPGLDLSMPSREPPPGVVPDYVSHSGLLDFTISVGAIFLPLMYLFLGIHLYMHAHGGIKWKIDDSIVIFAAIVCTTLAALILAYADKLAKNSWDVPLGVVIAASTQKIMVAQFLFSNLALLAGKFCLLSMYYRIFGHIKRVRWQIYGAGALTLPIFVSMIVQPVMIAPPLGKPFGCPNGDKENMVIVGLMGGIDNLLVDLVIAYIPLPVISQLNLSRNKKNGVIALFATGSIAVVADCITLYFRIRLFHHVDQLRDGYVVHNCAIIESSISIILSSLPSTTKLFHVYIEPTQMYQSLRSRLGSSRGTENGSFRNRSNPTIGSDPKPAKKKRDPYSINMPTTFLSTKRASLNDSSELELSPRKNGDVQTHIGSSRASEELASGDIHRKISVEQSSASFHGSEQNWHDEGGLLRN